MLIRQGAFLEEGITVSEKDRRYRVLIFDQKSGNSSPVRTVFADTVAFEARVHCVGETEFKKVEDAIKALELKTDSIPADTLVTYELRDEMEVLNNTYNQSIAEYSLAINACDRSVKDCLVQDFDPLEEYTRAIVDNNKVFDMVYKVNAVLSASRKTYYKLQFDVMKTDVQWMRESIPLCQNPNP